MAYFIFDYDGTLGDSLHTICHTMKEAFLENGQNPPSDEQTRDIIGITLEQAIEILLRETEQSFTAELINSITLSYKTNYSLIRTKLASDMLFAHTHEMLESVNEKGHLCAIATGKTMKGLLHEVERHNIKKYFVSLQSSDLHPSKPNPSMIYTALDEMGGDVKNCFMIGDSIYDMEMAQNAGVIGIGVSWGTHSPEILKKYGAKHIIQNWEELKIFI